MNLMLAKKSKKALRYQILLCSYCKHREWAKEGNRVGFCKASGKPIPLIDDGKSLNKTEPCSEFERGKRG